MEILLSSICIDYDPRGLYKELSTLISVIGEDTDEVYVQLEWVR